MNPRVNARCPKCGNQIPVKDLRYVDHWKTHDSKCLGSGMLVVEDKRFEG
jgi:hypothetical protein